MTQSGSSKFTIDQSSGAVSLLAPLDYEALPAGSKNYELTVTATDGGALIVSPHKVGAGRGVLEIPPPPCSFVEDISIPPLSALHVLCTEPGLHTC